MPSYVVPKKAVEFIFYVSLVDTANQPDFKSAPTIAAGDFKVSKDGGALANLATLPAVTPAASVMVKVTLSATEMTADNVTVICIDAAGAEWDDLVINIHTAARQIDDLAYPTTSGRSTDVTATGAVGVDFDNVEGTLNAASLNADLDTYQAKVTLTDDDGGSADRYEVRWFKNGEVVTSGITSPTIQVIKSSDATDLVASVAMTEIGSLGKYKHTETTNRIVDGATYDVKVQATIGGATREWSQPVSRDS